MYTVVRLTTMPAGGSPLSPSWLVTSYTHRCAGRAGRCYWQVPIHFIVLLTSCVLLTPPYVHVYMLLAAFSHRSLLHLGCNLWVLHNFATPLQERWGTHALATAYVGACVFSSAGVSILAALLPALAGPGLGASGAVFALVAASCLVDPSSRVCIPFLPEFSLAAGAGLQRTL